MRGDMSGAATVAGALHAAVSLALKRNVVVLAPLCENMPSGKATRPGDILTAMNGVTVEVRTALLCLARSLVAIVALNDDA